MTQMSRCYPFFSAPLRPLSFQPPHSICLPTNITVVQRSEVRSDEGEIQDKGDLPVAALVAPGEQCVQKASLATRLAAFQTTVGQARQQAVLTALQAAASERRQQVCLLLDCLGLLWEVLL